MSEYIDVLDRLCRQASDADGGEWYHDGATFGPFDATFTCPCGTRIEPDGQCPDGHVSPLRRYGLISSSLTVSARERARASRDRGGAEGHRASACHAGSWLSDPG